MKPFQDNTSAQALTTQAQMQHGQQSLRLLHARLARSFARPEPFARTLLFLQAIVGATERKNGWQIAEHAGERTPCGMQRLLSQAVWDADGVRDELRTFALEHLGRQSITIALDESGFLKRGSHSAGVGLQYYGPTGDLRNCQVGVFLSLVTERGHCLIDRELYLPADWCQDPERCAQVGLDPPPAFQTKPQLGWRMLQRLFDAQIPIDWVVADSFYGSNPELRCCLEEQGQAYVMAVASTQPIVLPVPDLGVQRLLVRDLPAQLASTTWRPLSLSQGLKGPRLFDWVSLPIWHPGTQDGWHRVLIRRSQTPDDPEYGFFLVFAPPQTSLQELVSAWGQRWSIEVDLENGKDLGLDHYEVRSWLGWYRHLTLVLLVLASLTAICLQAPSEQEQIPLSVPEARRLLGRLFFPPRSSLSQILAWSHWRRVHQYRASCCHTRHRLKAG